MHKLYNSSSAFVICNNNKSTNNDVYAALCFCDLYSYLFHYIAENNIIYLCITDDVSSFFVCISGLIRFWATICKTVCPVLSDCCLSVCLSVCDVGVL